jgi:hypothetical protein
MLLVLSLGATPGPASGQRTWKYTVLPAMSFPSAKKMMWACPDRKIAGQVKVPDALNLMGGDGWELVAVICDKGGGEPFVTTHYFKQPH